MRDPPLHERAAVLIVLHNLGLDFPLRGAAYSSSEFSLVIGVDRIRNATFSMNFGRVGHDFHTARKEVADDNISRRLRLATEREIDLPTDAGLRNLIVWLKRDELVSHGRPGLLHVMKAPQKVQICNRRTSVDKRFSLLVGSDRHSRFLIAQDRVAAEFLVGEAADRHLPGFCPVEWTLRCSNDPRYLATCALRNRIHHRANPLRLVLFGNFNIPEFRKGDSTPIRQNGDGYEVSNAKAAGGVSTDLHRRNVKRRALAKLAIGPRRVQEAFLHGRRIHTRHIVFVA